jgi:hypothetical protein
MHTAEDALDQPADEAGLVSPTSDKVPSVSAARATSTPPSHRLRSALTRELSR